MNAKASTLTSANPPKADRGQASTQWKICPRPARYTYTAFGQQYGETSAETLPQRYTFTGRESAGPAAAAGGAPMYYRYRMYSAGLGRFGRRDPVLDAANQYNQYAYAGGRVVGATDPAGSEVVTIAVTTFTVGKGISNLICAAIAAKECATCIDRAKREMNRMAAYYASRDDPYAMAAYLRTTKPGSECSEVCDLAGKHAIKGVVWLVSGVIVKYGIRRV